MKYETGAVQAALAQVTNRGDGDVATDAHSRKVMRAIAYFALGIAFFTPFVAAGTGLIPSVPAGYFVAKVLGAVLFGMAANEIVLQKWPTLKAATFLLIGLVALIGTATFMATTLRNAQALAVAMETKAIDSNIAQARAIDSAENATLAADAAANEKTVAFLKTIKTMQAAYSGKIDALAEESNAIHLADALSPANMTDYDKLDAAAVLLSRHANLIEQRRLLYDAYMTNAEHFFRTADVAESQRLAVLLAFLQARETGAKHFGELETIQRKGVSLLWDLINFAKSNVGRITASKDRLQFRTATDAERYNAIVAALDANAELEEKATQVLADDAQNSQRNDLSAGQSAP
jgi:hypothetical protein